MQTYYFTNRRRAKDVIMLFRDENATDGLIVFVRAGLVYLRVDEKSIPTKIEQQLDAILHYAELDDKPIEDLLQLDQITELYQKDGIARFRV